MISVGTRKIAAVGKADGKVVGCGAEAPAEGIRSVGEHVERADVRAGILCDVDRRRRGVGGDSTSRDTGGGGRGEQATGSAALGSRGARGVDADGENVGQGIELRLRHRTVAAGGGRQRGAGEEVHQIGGVRERVADAGQRQRRVRA